MGNNIASNDGTSVNSEIKEYNDDGCISSGLGLPLCRGAGAITSCSSRVRSNTKINKQNSFSSNDNYDDIVVPSDPESSAASSQTWRNPQCGEPGVPTELHNLISAPASDRKWDLVLKRLKSHPEEAKASKRDEKCRTALALACSDPTCPSHVIREILSVCPRSPHFCDKNGAYPLHCYATSESPHKEMNLLQLICRYNSDATMARNKYGNTPLQAVIEMNKPRVNVLLELIKANSKAVSMTNGHGSYPLHYAWKDHTPDLKIVKLLLKVYPRAALLQNDYGATPIFMAVNWDASLEVMEALLKVCPAAVRIKDERGICSISSAWNLFIHQVKVDDETDVIKEKERVKRNRRLIKSATSPYDLEGKAEIWWNKMQLLIKASYHNSIADPLPNSKWRVLHAAAGCDCPPELLTLVLKLYRNLLFIKDENDNLPLHIICATPPYVKQPFEFTSEPSVSKLADEYPDAAKIPDARGRLPLHIALSHSRVWDEGVSHLVELHRESVRCQDPTTRLYPFLLAAARDDSPERVERKQNVAERTAKTRFKGSVWKRMSRARKEREVQSALAQRGLAELDTVYKLLLCAPDLITILGDEIRNKEKVYLKQDNEKQFEKFREMNHDAIALKKILDVKEREYKSKLIELERELAYLKEKEADLCMSSVHNYSTLDNRDDIACK